MALSDAEIAYLQSQRLGRLATIQPDGSPQVKPLGFSYNADLGTIDIHGFRMSGSQKFRNVSRDGRAVLVVDDIVSTQPSEGRRVLPHRPSTCSFPAGATDAGSKQG